MDSLDPAEKGKNCIFKSQKKSTSSRFQMMVGLPTWQLYCIEGAASYNAYMAQHELKYILLPKHVKTVRDATIESNSLSRDMC